MSLSSYHTENTLEIGVDEVARGCIFGRTYAAAVIWPPGLTSHLVKDSKKYTNRAQRELAYDFIVENAVAYGVASIESEQIDQTNISKAIMCAMHEAIRQTSICPEHILVDGNYFKPFIDDHDNVPKFTTIVGGDNKYYSIAAASVIAKVSHDRYIQDLCNQYPILDRYDLRNNMGYGSPSHMIAIKTHGITQYHRKSYKCCTDLPVQQI
jgi:ribonuclease HII